MRIVLVTIFCLFLINFIFSQSIQLNGTIIDENTKQPLPFGTIELFSLKTGTITDENGKFIIEVIPHDLTSDTIVFSYLGYEKIEMAISDFLKLDNAIALKEKTVILDEIKITPKNYVTTTLGIKDKKPRSRQFTSLFTAKKGNFIQNSERKSGWFKSVSYYIHQDGIPSTPFRIRIYAVGKNGKPGKDLLNTNLIVAAKKSGWLTIDISDYNVPFPKNGAFVMMEWINSGEEYYFEKEVSTRGKDGKLETTKRKYYGQSLGTVKKRSGVVLWGNSLGNDWIPYDFNNRGKYPNAMINAEVLIEKD